MSSFNPLVCKYFRLMRLVYHSIAVEILISYATLDKKDIFKGKQPKGNYFTHCFSKLKVILQLIRVESCIDKTTCASSGTLHLLSIKYIKYICSIKKLLHLVLIAFICFQPWSVLCNLNRIKIIDKSEPGKFMNGNDLTFTKVWFKRNIFHVSILSL